MGEQEKCDDWNANYPIGRHVGVRKDDGTEWLTQTRSKAWVLGGQTAVIQLVGMPGCFSLDRVRPAEEGLAEAIRDLIERN